jgi:hypothetical protein
MDQRVVRVLEVEAQPALPLELLVQPRDAPDRGVGGVHGQWRRGNVEELSSSPTTLSWDPSHKRGSDVPDACGSLVKWTA